MFLKKSSALLTIRTIRLYYIEYKLERTVTKFVHKKNGKCVLDWTTGPHYIVHNNSHFSIDLALSYAVRAVSFAANSTDYLYVMSSYFRFSNYFGRNEQLRYCCLNMCLCLMVPRFVPENIKTTSKRHS